MRVSKFLNLSKVEFDGCLTSEHCHDNFDFLTFCADRFDNSDEVFESAVDDSDVVADFDIEIFDADVSRPILLISSSVSAIGRPAEPTKLVTPRALVTINQIWLV